MKRPIAIDPMTIDPVMDSRYPSPFDEPVAGREKRKLGDAFGLTGFGVNLVHIPPGTWSAQRHAHEKEDEFICIVDGELVLVTDAGETVLTAGMVAGFPASSGDGHHLINRTDRPAVYLEVGGRIPGESVTYSDIDMMVVPEDERGNYRRKDGTPY